MSRGQFIRHLMRMFPGIVTKEIAVVMVESGVRSVNQAKKYLERG